MVSLAVRLRNLRRARRVKTCDIVQVDHAPEAGRDGTPAVANLECLVGH